MAPTPYVPDAKLVLNFVVSGLPHEIDFPVDTTFTGGIYYISTNFGTPLIDLPQTVADAIWLLLKTQYPASVNAPNWTLYIRDVNIFIPVSGGACTGVGTSGAGASLGTQTTLTFRDADQVLYRLQLPEAAQASPQKVQFAGVAGNLGAIFQDVVDTSTNGALGQWIRTRSNLQPTRGLNASVSENFKYKRARGI